MPGGGSCVEGHDDGEEWACMADCSGFEDLNEHDGYFCDWLLDVFPTGCAYDCNQDILNQIEEWMIECDESNEDNWDDNENYCEGLTEDECFITDGCQWYYWYYEIGNLFGYIRPYFVHLSGRHLSAAPGRS